MMMWMFMMRNMVCFLFVCGSLFVVCCLLFVVCCLLFVVCCLLFVVCYAVVGCVFRTFSLVSSVVRASERTNCW